MPTLKSTAEVSVERDDAETNLYEIMEIYDQFNQNRTGTIVRKPRLLAQPTQRTRAGPGPVLDSQARRENRRLFEKWS